jgi:hypothetical protein
MVTTDEVRSLALSLPETEEHDHWGKPSFRVQNKIYAVFQPDGVSIVVKTTKEERFTYLTMTPEIYRMPENFSNLAYMMVRMDRVEPKEFHDILTLAWSLVSPKKVVKAYVETALGRSYPNGPR